MNPNLPPFPQALEDDDDDVAWALQTAQVQWARGGQADAIVWLRRAADSADQIGNVWRAADLRRMADDLTAALSAPAPSVRPPMPPARPSLSVRGGSDVDDLLGDDDDGLSPVQVAASRSVLPRPPPPPPIAPLPSFPLPEDEEDDDYVSVETQSAEPFEEDVVSVDEETTEEDVLAEDEPAEEEEIIADDDLADDDEIEEAALLDDDEVEVEVEVDETPHVPQGFVEHETSPGLDLPRYSLPDSLDDPVTQPNSLDLSAISARSEELEARAAPPPPEPEPEPEPEVEDPGEPMLGDVLLADVHGLEDVPPEGQVELMRKAVVERLNREEEVSAFGLALVLRGAVSVMPTIADVACARAKKGDIVWSQGNVEDGVALRLVAAENDTEVAVWDASVLRGAVAEYPWVVEDLKALADRFQALAGVSMGAMGERLDESLRSMVTDRCEVKRLLPGEELVTKGKPVGGMFIIAAGRIQIGDDGEVLSELGPGEFLFASQVLAGGAAPHAAVAAKGGALVLFAGRHAAHELLLSVPPLLEIFAS